jgi:hypothetical protein
MIACCLKRVLQPGEDRSAIVVDWGGLAVHQASSPNDPAAERRADALMAETDAKDRDLSCKPQDEVAADAGFFWGLRSRRDHNLIWSQLRKFIEGHLVIPEDPGTFAKLAQVLDQIIGEGVIVVDHDQHSNPLPFVQHFKKTLTNPLVLILRDGAKTARLLRMTGEGRLPLTLRKEGPVSSPVRPEEARRAKSRSP